MFMFIQQQPKARESASIHRFSQQEDVALKNAVMLYGSDDWNLIASCIPGLTPRQCKDRWTNYVNPDIVDKPWSNEEDELLLERYKVFGSKWRLIVQAFPSRSINNIRNRFNYLKKRGSMPLKRSSSLPPQKLDQPLEIAPKKEEFNALSEEPSMTVDELFDFDDNTSLMDDFTLNEWWI